MGGGGGQDMLVWVRGGPRYAGLGMRGGGAKICWPGYEEGQDMLNGSYILVCMYMYGVMICALLLVYSCLQIMWSRGLQIMWSRGALRLIPLLC